MAGSISGVNGFGSGQIDVTSESIARITANIAGLDMILADYDVKSSPSRSIPIDELNAAIK